MRQAIEDIAADAGVNIIADPTVQGIVTVTIEDATVDKALDLLLAGTEFQVQRTPDYYLVYSADASSDLLTAVSETRVVELQHISPEAARALLPGPLQQYVRFEPGASSRIAVTAPREILDRILADLEQIDQSNAETVFVTLRHIEAEQARTLLPESLQRFVRVDPTRNIVAITAPTNARADIEAQLDELDQPGPPLALGEEQLNRTKFIKLSHIPAESVTNLLPAGMIDYVRSDATSNTISISAPDHISAQIIANVRNLDVPRAHILLEARIVVLDRSDILSFGGTLQNTSLRIGASNSAAQGFQYDISVGQLQTQTFTNALNLTLNLLSQNDEATIVASPNVLAQDGIPAEIKVTTEEYIQIDAVSNGVVRGELEQIETGTTLGITPQVGANGALTLDMNLEVSDVISRGAEGLPVVSRRTAKSKVQLYSGGTAAVAGLVDSRTQTGTSGTPGSEGLPLLGRLFRTDSLNHNARQVAIFVTATLVDQHGNKIVPRGQTTPQSSRVDEAEYRAQLRSALIDMGVAIDVVE